MDEKHILVLLHLHCIALHFPCTSYQFNDVCYNIQMLQNVACFKSVQSYEYGRQRDNFECYSHFVECANVCVGAQSYCGVL